MSIMKTLNPWRALRETEAKLHHCEEMLAKEIDRAQHFSLLALGRAHEISRMQKLLKNCHYRDPKTGRISAKGVLPQ